MSSTGRSSATPAPALDAPSPDALRCPICDYNLHGLPDPRCPECGFKFEWSDLQSDQSGFAYFFETARSSPMRAFVRTLLYSALPTRFWRTIRPALRPRPRRLIIYGLIAMVLGLLPAILIGGAPLYGYAQWNLERRRFILDNYARPKDADSETYAIQLAKPFGTVEQYVDWAYPGFSSLQFWKHGLASVSGGAFLPAIVVGWPVLTFLSLMIFRVSLLNARVSPAQVLRCTVYSGDAVAWLLPLLLIVIPALVLVGTESVLWNGYLPIALLILLAARIVISYQLYLRIRRGLAMVICSQVMAALVFSKLALWLNGY
jgi:hypothetical protein